MTALYRDTAMLGPLYRWTRTVSDSPHVLELIEVTQRKGCCRKFLRSYHDELNIIIIVTQDMTSKTPVRATRPTIYVR